MGFGIRFGICDGGRDPESFQHMEERRQYELPIHVTLLADLRCLYQKTWHDGPEDFPGQAGTRPVACRHR